jgi:hypothetical protein
MGTIDYIVSNVTDHAIAIIKDIHLFSLHGNSLIY